MEHTEIKAGQGLGEIKFGMNREQVQALLGDPDEIDQDGDAEDYIMESWHYDAYDMSMSFDEGEEFRLVTIAASAEEYTINGQQLIGLNKTDLITKLRMLEFGKLSFEDVSEDDDENHSLVSAEEFAVNFWLEDDEVTEIQWTPVFVTEDVIRWPE